MTAHDVDCDGYGNACGPVRVDHDRRGRGMFTAVCVCGWSGSTYGPEGRQVARREADAHEGAMSVPCSGRCLTTVVGSTTVTT